MYWYWTQVLDVEIVFNVGLQVDHLKPGDLPVKLIYVFINNSIIEGLLSSLRYVVVMIWFLEAAASYSAKLISI